MSIPDEEVAQVRAATDVVALIGEHVALRKQGARWTGLCPFHSEKTPSFSVNPEAGFYYCFGCQASGDAITFVRAMEHLDFVDAVRALASKAGVVLHEDASTDAVNRRRSGLLDAMERAVSWYHERLLAAPDAGRAREYLRSRGYDGDVVRKFRLGWAPDDWDSLARALSLPERVLTESGLGFVNRRGRTQDAFRARVMFPICDSSGRPVALGGRILPARPDQAEQGGGETEVTARSQPKYKNSTETPIYAKRRTLYALNWAKHDIVSSGEVVVCEGYTDVIGCFTAGIPRAVATCGTSLTEEHFAQLRNFGRRIVLAYDADGAGRSATERVYEWERRHEVEVAVADLPSGSDPGELARTDPDALRRALESARPFLRFRVDRIIEAAQLTSAEGRAKAASAAIDAVAEHPDELVRDQYVMQIADWCRLDADLLRPQLEEVRRRPRSPRPARPQSRGEESRGQSSPASRRSPNDGGAQDPATSPPIDDGDPGPTPPDDLSAASSMNGQRAEQRSSRPTNESRPGLEALRLAVHYPDTVAHRLDAVLFLDDLQRDVFLALSESDDLPSAVETAAPEVADLLRRVAVEEPLFVENPVEDPIDSVVNRLITNAVKVALATLGASARTSGGDSKKPNAETGMVMAWLQELGDPDAGHVAGERLVAWLVGRAVRSE